MTRRAGARGRVGSARRRHRSRRAFRTLAALKSHWWRSRARSRPSREILVLDEPTASLPADEVARLFSALHRLRARGVAMIYVSHRLDEVFEIADRMTVLRDGRVAGERDIANTTPDEAILLIVGREPSQVFRRPPERHGSPRLALESVMVEEVGPIGCEIHSGEIVGLVGLRGAGQESIGRALFGVLPVTGGQILLDGRQVAVSSPREAMARGINLVCADRVSKSIMPNLSVRENLFLNPVAAGLSLFSFISPGRENSLREGAPASRSDYGRTIRRSRSSFCREATNRRWWWDAGCTLTRRSTCSRIRPRASTSGPRRRSIVCSTLRFGGSRDHRRIHRFRRGGEGLPPRADLQSWPGGRGSGRR